MKGHEGVPFSIDAGIIIRLGQELVAREATAVSELIKNAYDADAREVSISFKDTLEEGGSLTIIDDGHGMTYDQLVRGFLRIASGDKVRNPRSPKFNRQRAGRKGIGRFATQRLGKKLRITTFTESKDEGYELIINWDEYKTGTEISEITNVINMVPKPNDIISGSKIEIDDLRDKWTEAKVRRVFRFISDLLQPTFLSDESKSKLLGGGSYNSENYFDVSCYLIIDEKKIIIDTESIVFDASIAVIEGRIENGRGICTMESDVFEIHKSTIEIEGKYSLIENTRFKVYYYIWGVNAFDKYYKGRIAKPDFSNIKRYSEQNGGVKVYRNGYRVLPYGESGNDWLELDKKHLKIEEAYIPISNRSIIGFVEIIDTESDIFEETASREGLIENDAFEQLVLFVKSAIVNSLKRINAKRLRLKKIEENKEIKKDKLTLGRSTLDELKYLIKEKEGAIQELQKKRDKYNKLESELMLLKILKLEIEEVEQTRILAGIGISLALFTHEVRGFFNSMSNAIHDLDRNKTLDKKVQQRVSIIKDSFEKIRNFIYFIDNTVKENISRDRVTLILNQVIYKFLKSLDLDAKDSDIDLRASMKAANIELPPMHPAEWNSILYNLYSNSKKAISRARANSEKTESKANFKRGKILITGGETNNTVFLEFSDNGDGIKDEHLDYIFDAFFTTAAPQYNPKGSEVVVGTGLGLKIVKDIIEGYKGTINVIKPVEGFSTTIKIEIPKNNEKEN